MNPTPHGYVIPGVHLGTPELSERELHRIVARTWTCAECGHREHDTSPKRLRDKARRHANTEHRPVVA